LKLASAQARGRKERASLNLKPGAEDCQLIGDIAVQDLLQPLGTQADLKFGFGLEGV